MRGNFCDVNRAEEIAMIFGVGGGRFCINSISLFSTSENHCLNCHASARSSVSLLSLAFFSKAGNNGAPCRESAAASAPMPADVLLYVSLQMIDAFVCFLVCVGTADHPFLLF